MSQATNSLFELRKIVEPEAAALVAERRTDTHIGAMAGALEGVERHALPDEQGRVAD